MNKSPLTTVLLVLLTASALASVLLCWGYISNTREIPAASRQAAMVNNYRALINSLASDVRNYSTNNPNSGVPLPPSGPPAAAAKSQGK